jgi:hypothetical protein
MASQEKSLVRLLGEDVDIVTDITERYKSLCSYIGWTPWPLVADHIRRYAEDLESALAMLADSNAYDLYPNTLDAHRYLAALAAVIEALRYCGGAPELDWLCCREVYSKLVAAIGTFIIHGSAAPVAGAVCDALPQLCDP